MLPCAAFAVSEEWRQRVLPANQPIFLTCTLMCLLPACLAALCRRPTSLRADEGALALLAEHRAGVVPLLIRLLFPKMRKRSGRLGGKGGLGAGAGAVAGSLLRMVPCTDGTPLCGLLLLLLVTVVQASMPPVHPS
jgi:hypothetical protein